jgi:hypothetical protein
MKISDIFNTKNILIGILVIVVGVLVYFLIHLNSELNTVRETNTALQNQLAESDSLRSVLLENAKVLSEKFASIGDSYNKILKQNSELKDYVKQKELAVLSLGVAVSEVKLENIKMKSQLEQLDSVTYQANFDSVNIYWSFEEQVKIDKKSAELSILSLTIPDSTYFGTFKQKNGILTGFIMHTNPYILDKNAEFSINLDIPDDSSGVSPWLVATGIGLAAGVTGYAIGGGFK